jgi:S1-C subfamily serine protease
MTVLRLALCLSSAVALSAPLLPDEKNNVDVYQTANPAVVNITSVTLTRDFWMDIIPQTGVGSGFVYRTDGYIVTNFHVVANARKLEVTLFDKTSFPAQVTGLDPDSDLAVLKIDPKATKLHVLKFALEDKPAVGQKVLAIGNPFGLGGSLSVGVISSLERDIRTPSDSLMKDVIQTDASINPGNSGGPLLDSSGNVLGVNTQIVSTSGGSVGVGFAISAKTASRIVEQLIRFGKIQRPELGLEGVGLSAPLLEAFKVPINYGIMITGIAPRGPAKRAGLRAADREVVLGFRRIPYGGDVLYRVDDTPVATMRDLLDYVFEKKVGETVVLHYFRDGRKLSTNVKL